LISNSVANSGSITSNLGAAALGAGSSVSLTFSGNDLVHMQVDKGVLNALGENGGIIQADGGYLIMTAGAKDELLASVVNNTGIVRAQTVQDKAGDIVLLGGMTSGTVNVGGTIDASAPNGGNGGRIAVSANAVNVSSGATLDATGTNGGGIVEVGGGLHGADASLPNATTVNVATGALVDASATGKGSGGTIAVWSNVSDPNSTTRAYGTLLAAGGASGGAGGIIETSGHWLDVAGIHVSASSSRGNPGQWLSTRTASPSAVQALSILLAGLRLEPDPTSGSRICSMHYKAGPASPLRRVLRGAKSATSR
jgi:large exoprotein involved in heme utilization and adhesion